MKTFLCCITVVFLMMTTQLAAFAGEGTTPQMTEKDLMKASHEKQLKDGHIDFWSIEERHEFEKPFVEYLLAQVDNPYHMPLNGLPGEGDISLEKANELAIEAVKAEFGEGAFDDGRVWWERECVYFFEFFGNERDGDHEWRIRFDSRAKGSKKAPIPYYEVWLDAKTGEVNKVFTDRDFLKSNPGR